MQREVNVLKERARAQELEVEAEEREIRRAAEAGEVKERWELEEGRSEEGNWRMRWAGLRVYAGEERGKQQGVGSLKPGGTPLARWVQAEAEEQVMLELSSEEEQEEQVCGEPLKPGSTPPAWWVQRELEKEEMRRGTKRKARGERWTMEGFSVDPGSAKLVQEGYTVGRVRTQVSVEVDGGTERWLGVALKVGGIDVTGWMQEDELSRRAAAGQGWKERLRGAGKEGWDVAARRWVSKVGVLDADREGGGNRGAGRPGGVVGWYLPVMVTGEKISRAGVRLCVRMRRVAVGTTAGGYEQAVRIRSRRKWCRHEMDRKELVAITGELVQAGGRSELLVEGQAVWREWGGQEGGNHVVDETDWRKRRKQEWRTGELVVGAGYRLRYRRRDQTYYKG